MERMEESVPDIVYDQLQHFLTKSTWDYQNVINRVARQADQLLGGHADSCLMLDETCFEKKGIQSAGVARQWCGRLGKIENCQVGVFATLSDGHRVMPVGAQLYLPEEWTSDQERCEKSKIPVDNRVFQTKSAIGLDLIKNLRNQGVRFKWVTADGVYGGDTTFLRQLEENGETFVMDVRSNQRIFLQDPNPQIPPAPENGRPTTIQRSSAQSIRVDKHCESLSTKKWRRVRLRRGTKGEIWAEAIKIPVWIWPQKGIGRETCSQWTLIVTRDPKTKRDIKYSLTNAPHQTALRRLAFMQRQRFWIEQAFKEAKSTCGLADYQVRSWVGWHRHVALVMMVQCFIVQERMTAPKGMEILSANDIRDILVTFLPKQGTNADDILARIEKRHRKRECRADSGESNTPK